MYAMSSLRCPSRKQQIRSQSFAILMPSAFLLSFAWMSPLPAIALLNQWLCGLTRPDWLDGAQPKEGLSVVLLVISSWGVWLGKRRQLLHALQLEFIIEKIQSLSRILLVTELKSHKVDLGPGQQWLAESGQELRGHLLCVCVWTCVYACAIPDHFLPTVSVHTCFLLWVLWRNEPSLPLCQNESWKCQQNLMNFGWIL